MKAEVSRKKQNEFDGEKWNAFINLFVNPDLDDLSPIQKPAYISWRYSSEVLNGGHFQYFENCSDLNNSEVLSALKALGALEHAKLLKKAIELKDSGLSDDEIDNKMEEIDNAFYGIEPAIETALLEQYLNNHESEFIEWVQ